MKSRPPIVDLGILLVWTAALIVASAVALYHLAAVVIPSLATSEALR